MSNPILVIIFDYFVTLGSLLLIMTDTSANITLVRQFFDKVVNQGMNSEVDNIMASDYVMNGGTLGTYSDREAYKAFLKANAGGAFTNMRLDVKDIVASDNKVFVLFSNSGKNTGSFMGMDPTHKEAKWNGTVLFCLKDGRIIESHYVEDLVSMFAQLGMSRLPGA